jgi:hypothetical protein
MKAPAKPAARRHTVNLVCDDLTLKALKAVAAAHGQPLSRWLLQTITEGQHAGEIASARRKLESLQFDQAP